jgi:hypothetical protein
VADAVKRSALISPCGAYRYSLTRIWEERRLLLPVMMLNPSKADAEIDDPTIVRVMGFARRERYGGIVVANLHAFRSTDPNALLRRRDPSGPGNNKALIALADSAVANATPVLCGWGNNGNRKGADASAIALFRRAGASLVCLGKTANGSPRHPLYVRADHPFETFP